MATALIARYGKILEHFDRYLAEPETDDAKSGDSSHR